MMRPACRLFRGQDLREVMVKVAHVVLRDEAEGDGGSLVERAELREIGFKGRDHVAGDARRHVSRIAHGAGLGGAGGRVDCQATACQRPSPFFTYTSVNRIWKGAGPIVADSTCTVAVPVRTA